MLSHFLFGMLGSPFKQANCNVNNALLQQSQKEGVEFPFCGMLSDALISCMCAGRRTARGLAVPDADSWRALLPDQLCSVPASGKHNLVACVIAQSLMTSICFLMFTCTNVLPSSCCHAKGLFKPNCQIEQ